MLVNKVGFHSSLVFFFDCRRLVECFSTRVQSQRGGDELSVVEKYPRNELFILKSHFVEPSQAAGIK